MMIDLPDAIPRPERLAPSAFHFVVSFNGDDIDGHFLDVSGLSSTIEVAIFVEGEENRFSHKLPKPAKDPYVVLERGILLRESPFAVWCNETLEKNLPKPIEPRVVMVKLLDNEGNPARSWTLSNCWPIKWGIIGFDSTENALTIETIWLAHNSLQLDVQEE